MMRRPSVSKRTRTRTLTLARLYIVFPAESAALLSMSTYPTTELSLLPEARSMWRRILRHWIRRSSSIAAGNYHGRRSPLKPMSGRSWSRLCGLLDSLSYDSANLRPRSNKHRESLVYEQFHEHFTKLCSSSSLHGIGWLNDHRLRRLTVPATCVHLHRLFSRYFCCTKRELVLVVRLSVASYIHSMTLNVGSTSEPDQALNSALLAPQISPPLRSGFFNSLRLKPFRFWLLLHFQCYSTY
jgi:hypothetical protein